MPSSKLFEVGSRLSVSPWINIPLVLLISAYFARKWYLARRFKLCGIGKGAKGFQTNVRQVRVRPEIAARIRRGEDVSPAEIEATSKAADEEAREAREAREGKSKPPAPQPRVFAQRHDRHLIGKDGACGESAGSTNEWLPDAITKPSIRRKGRK